MDESGLGGEFRALRVAAGRTVASVAVDAGLSVPYIANLENGRGNPTVGALSRLASALGRRLVIGLSGEAADPDNSKKRVAVPASLGRFARTARFRRAAATIADVTGQDGADFSPRLVTGLAALASVLDRDLGEADWGRLLDAVLLVNVDPRGSD